MMTVAVAVMLVLTGLMGTAVVLSAKPERQALTLSAFGLCLAVLLMALQAPDAALSQIGVGTAIVPLMVMLCFRKVQQRQ